MSRPAMSNGSRADLRREGRGFLIAFSAALKSFKLYPVENDQVQRALDDLVASTDRLHEGDALLDIRVASDIIFVNGTRLRVDLDNHGSFTYVTQLSRRLGIGRIQVETGVDRGEWQGLITLLLEAAANDPDPEALPHLQRRLNHRGVLHVVLEEAGDDERDLSDANHDVEMAKRTYERTVAVTREVVNNIRLGRGSSVKKVKRAVQGIVDQVLNNEVSLIGLTTLRDYDEYTFTHSVNVCIFAVALGRRLSLDKRQLYDLGMAALLHDVGKSRVPLEILNKEESLDHDEWRTMQDHPWFGVLTLFKLRNQADVPYRSMITAYEHHMKVDMTGYPRSIRPRTLNLFSKIVAVVDGFDAATSRRSYQTVPLTPDRVLMEMWNNLDRGFDRVLVKELINLLGVYPVGTGVILSTREVAVVHAASTDPERLNRPVVRIVADAEGRTLRTGRLAELSETDADGDYVRSIVRVTSLEQFGLNPAEYFT